MSLSINYLTNGERKIYRVRNAGVSPMTIDIYEKREDIPESIRHYAPKGEPTFVGPDGARFLGVLDELYPNFHIKCQHPDHLGKNCIAESCIFAEEAGDYEKCPHYEKV